MRDATSPAAQAQELPRACSARVVKKGRKISSSSPGGTLAPESHTATRILPRAREISTVKELMHQPECVKWAQVNGWARAIPGRLALGPNDRLWIKDLIEKRGGSEFSTTQARFGELAAKEWLSHYPGAGSVSDISIGALVSDYGPHWSCTATRTPTGSFPGLGRSLKPLRPQVAGASSNFS